MLIPEKLTISNYCQIKDLKVDFSAHNVLAITASNGRGKTNTLNALRFALSGQASPGADKLTDDIRDQASEAVVELDFSLTGGSGHIRRVIGRKNTTCSLRLELNGGVEEYTKTTDAEKRFTSLLGVSPKHISEVIIAEQHSIDALLFWPAAERGPKFQRFLHGEIFSEIEKLATKERKKVLLDPLAKDRLVELDKTQATEVERLRQVEQGLAETDRFLGSDAVSKLDTKVAQIKQFEKYQEEAAKLEAAIKEIQHVSQDSEAQLRQLTLLGEDTFSTMEKELEVLEAAWSQYRPFAQALALKKTLQPQHDQLLEAIAKLKENLNQEQNLAERITQLKSLVVYLRATAELQEFRTRHNAQQKVLSEVKRNISELTTKLDTLRKEQEKLPVATLHLLQEVFQYMESSQSSECIVCGSQISSVRISELKKRQQEYSRHHTRLSQDIELVAKQKQESEQQKNILQSEVSQLQSSIESLQAKLSKSDLDDDSTTEQAEAQLLEAQSNQLELNRKKLQLPKHEADLGAITRQLNQLERVPPAPAPGKDESALEELRQTVTAERGKRQRAHTISLQISKNHGRIEELEVQHTGISTALSKAGLPNLSESFRLQPEEEAKVDLIEQARASRQKQSEEKSGCVGAIKALDGQIKQARSAIEKSKEAEEYVSRLEQLEQWFRYSGIPSKIMQRQLNNLCGKMEEIISQFSLTRHFRLTVNENLEVFMMYANGTIRPIHKASGGERMILGIAFRLATHQYLSPELPFLALDEPSNHLVDTNQVVLQEIIRDLKNSLGKYGIRKLVYCTHSRALANEAEAIINLDTALRD